jgi:hypothetical protein
MGRVRHGYYLRDFLRPVLMSFVPTGLRPLMVLVSSNVDEFTIGVEKSVQEVKPTVR